MVSTRRNSFPSASHRQWPSGAWQRFGKVYSRRRSSRSSAAASSSRAPVSTGFSPVLPSLSSSGVSVLCEGSLVLWSPVIVPRPPSPPSPPPSVPMVDRVFEMLCYLRESGEMLDLSQFDFSGFDFGGTPLQNLGGQLVGMQFDEDDTLVLTTKSIVPRCNVSLAEIVDLVSSDSHSSMAVSESSSDEHVSVSAADFDVAIENFLSDDASGHVVGSDGDNDVCLGNPGPSNEACEGPSSPVPAAVDVPDCVDADRDVLVDPLSPLVSDQVPVTSHVVTQIITEPCVDRSSDSDSDSSSGSDASPIVAKADSVPGPSTAHARSHPVPTKRRTTRAKRPSSFVPPPQAKRQKKLW